MTSVHVKARFGSAEELERAMSDLRRLGAVRCAGPAGEWMMRAPSVVHVSVPPPDAALARAILRRAGGTILQ